VQPDNVKVDADRSRIFMHARLVTRFLLPLFASLRTRAAPRAAAPPRLYMLLATVDTDAVTALRHDIMATCGDRLESMRIEACDHGRQMKVRLHIASTGADGVIDDVLRRLYG
jgi:hypothetical protein